MMKCRIPGLVIVALLRKKDMLGHCEQQPTCALNFYAHSHLLTLSLVY